MTTDDVKRLMQTLKPYMKYASYALLAVDAALILAETNPARKAELMKNFQFKVSRMNLNNLNERMRSPF